MTRFDYVLVGGGLQNGLLALALRARRPEARIALVERDEKLGGNHTWCFHESDVPRGSMRWLDALVTYRWPGYHVLFPEREQRIDDAYSGVSSARLHEVVSASVRGHGESELLLGTAVEEVGSHSVRLGSGRQLDATVVVDGRGPRPLGPDAPAGYQKFVGLELELTAPHGLDVPTLMDTSVAQTEGFRFMYLLPFDERTVLVEDTYFNELARLDVASVREEVRAYVAGRGWRVSRELREESGVLPMPWAWERVPHGSPPLVAGYRGGWFHPGTGYSFPVALRLAEFVAQRPPEELFGPELESFARDHVRQATFAQFLNRLLFRWYPPSRRRFIFERFYRLPKETIARFYALDLRWQDGMRLLVGRPPKGFSLRQRLQPAPHEREQRSVDA